MPITAATFIMGWLAIAGVPPFAGFWSKDEILLFAWGMSPVLWAIGLVTALLTAFYMGRQVFMVFFGDERWRHAAVAEGAGTAHDPVGDGTADDAGEAVSAGDPATAAATHAAGDHGDQPEPHESPWLMTVPLVVLAVLSLVGGGLNLPLLGDLHFLGHWLEPVVGENEAHIDVSTAGKVALATIATIGSLIGIAAAYTVYLRRRVKAVEPTVLAHGYYYDEGISAFVAGPGMAGFEGVAAFDRGIIDGAVNGVATLVRGVGGGLRRVQTGFVRSYALGVAAGVVVVLGYFLTRLSF
jgi:NADH-quinone oxidoreductase subunit L